MKDRLIRFIVGLFPFDFRREFGADMERTYRDRQGSGTRFWRGVLVDVIRVAPRQHAEAVREDLRYAFRMLARRPVVTLACVFTLALGIGLNVAMFSVINAVLLRPLPYTDPAGLVMVFSRDLSPLADPMVQRGSAGALEGGLSVPDLLDFREQSSVFRSVAIVTSYHPNLTGLGDPARLNAASVSPGFFCLLGVSPIVGRDFTPNDNALSGEAAVVLSNGFWQRRLGGDPSVVGQSILLDRVPYRIRGVLPPDFRSPDGANWELYRAIIPRATPTNRSTRVFPVVARLATGDLERARSELSAIAARLADTYPATNTNIGVSVVRLTDLLPLQVRTGLVVLMGALILVLLIACTNIANLLLAQAAGREREFAIRLAVGAGRSRLAQQFLTESVLISTLGATLSVGVAYLGVQALTSFAPSDIPRLNGARVDSHALTVTALLAVVTGLGFGIAPAWRAANLKRTRPTRALVIGQVALAIVLLCGAGLLLRSLRALQAVYPGFRTANVVSLYTTMSRTDFRGVEQSAALFRELSARLSAVPGVESVGATLQLPIVEHDVDATTLVVHDRPLVAVDQRPTSRLLIATPGYFATIGVPLRRGRFFDERDQLDSPGVAIINEALAEELWANEDPIGKRVSLDLLLTPGEKPEREVVGVIGNIKHFGLEFADEPQLYIPHGQSPWPAMYFVVRTSLGLQLVAPTLRQAVWSVDPDLPVERVQELDDVLAAATGQPRFRAALVGAFSAAAMLLAAIGIYGVISHSVAGRSREIGIRMAFGAERKDVFALIMKQGVTVALIGAGLGTLGAALLARALSSLLFAVSPLDPLTFAMVLVVCLGSSVAACYLPARRAAAVNPAVAVRTEP